MSDSSKKVGKVKWFNETKGFGFIIQGHLSSSSTGEFMQNNASPDIFVHISAVERSGLRGLKENDIVEFEMKEDRNGRLAAVNLVLLEQN